ncbi:unnamed protein product [Prorocentrum cordatum]|uniref:Uncharacterized protein n=1 Tax=Prorocentrum cordatum TaxID=2364126 RepID=A0ABN9XHK1_9DINO|nr:unnamed protein product [Polarella glacialis]
MCPASIEDAIVSHVAELERSCHDKIVNHPSCKMEMPFGSEHLSKVMRFPPGEVAGQGTATESAAEHEEKSFVKIGRPEIPQDDSAYQAAIVLTAVPVTGSLSNHPDQRGALLKVMRESFGLELTEMETEQNSYDGR